MKNALLGEYLVIFEEEWLSILRFLTVHARPKMMASAEGKGFYERLKNELVSACPDERTLLEILKDIREAQQGTRKTT